MAQKNTIGLLFSYNENWIGGSYYILNLISAFKTLADEQQPQLVIFITNAEDEEKVIATGYPHLKFVYLNFKFTFWHRLVNKVTRFLRFKDLYRPAHDIRLTRYIFPYNFEESLRNINNKIVWIPDFQEYYLPEMFSEKNLYERKEHQKKLVQDKFPIIFSSYDSQNSFHAIYPYAQNRTFVVNFATTHPAYQSKDIELLLSKYNITKPYIISPNQFWKHKNHQVVLDAVMSLKQAQKLNFQVIFTGKEYDFRYPTYTQDLKNYVAQHGLEEHIKFLGFIDREEQLQLMQNADAVIQPSLFEGWSSVVEDAKTMSQYIVVSQIAVHEEQLANYPNKSFFNPNLASDLKEILWNIFEKGVTKQTYHYETNVHKFAQDFLGVIEALIHEKPL